MLIYFYSLFQIYETLGKANIPYLQVPGLEECFKQYECPFLHYINNCTITRIILT